MDLTLRRRFFAEEIEAASNIRTAALVEALASTPREQFLPPGPWMVKSEADVLGPPRLTPDADPSRVYHNLSVGIDPTRMLFNGAPGFVSFLIDSLALTAGARVLHVGCGLGYYTALIARVVGPSGHVVAMEVEEPLAIGARANLGDIPWVEVRREDATSLGDASYDAILINAGVTHPLPAWLTALRPGGRLMLPLTATFPGMGPISKGPVVMLTKKGKGVAYDARTITVTAIYSAVALRDDRANERVMESLKTNPMPRLKALRLDPHDASKECWLHGDGWCLTM
jgi:protein-L-isoaspartate(D-aspartate) O-methyltransferase